ncbi:MAG TPA: DUF3817 domain-containing protein [Acidimicrobiales bacterium]|nr:DUF3817 domain-containing protein [Acidimicrobiales bacterium]
MADFADDTSTELERKAKALRVVCLMETVSYLVLLWFWLSGNDLGTKIFGAVHGQFFVIFAAMVIGMFRPMGWSWRFLAAGLLTGPVGSLVVYERLRRHGVPGPVLAPATTG